MRVIVALLFCTLGPAVVVAVDAPASATAAAAPATAPATAPVAAVTGSVARAQFTSAVQDREPTDNLTSLDTGKTQVSFFSELKDLAGTRVVHRWEYQGRLIHEQPFDVGGARWRVWSNANFDPSMVGEWKVSVVDSAGNTLAVQTLSYGASVAAPRPAATPLKSN